MLSYTQNLRPAGFLMLVVVLTMAENRYFGTENDLGFEGDNNGEYSGHRSYSGMTTIIGCRADGEDDGKSVGCESDSNKFDCRGDLVVDCLESCSGLPNADVDRKECFKRRLFDRYLINDLIAACVWFVGAGLAMAAGVGGGGIYVPLGILLLRF